MGSRKRQRDAQPRGEHGKAKRRRYWQVLVAEGRSSSLSVNEFCENGHREVRSRPRFKKRVLGGRNRVSPIMRERNRLCPARVTKRPASEHTSCLATEAPNQMWDTDGAKSYKLEEGWCWIFAVVDHFNSEALGWHINKLGEHVPGA